MEIKYKDILFGFLAFFPFFVGGYIIYDLVINNAKNEINLVGWICILWFIALSMFFVMYLLWWIFNKLDKSNFLNKKIKL